MFFDAPPGGNGGNFDARYVVLGFILGLTIVGLEFHHAPLYYFPF